MLSIRTILHPTDFSAASEDAFDLACSLAGDYKASVIVLHVLGPEEESSSAEYGERVAIRKAVMQRLHHLQPPQNSLVEIFYRLEEGDPAKEILRVADETKCDLLIMGTHGRTGLGRALIGSVAETVLRHARCPVLTGKALPSAVSQPHQP